MKIAILGYGRQGKKYVDYFSRYNTNIDIYTRTGSLTSLKIEEFIPIMYNIIIIAIYPIISQEIQIQKILQVEFKGYLIIEKPIVSDIKLLKILTYREKTIFLIDEAYISQQLPSILALEPINIQLASNWYDDEQNVYEHAIGTWLGIPYFGDILNRACTTFLLGDYGYTISQGQRTIIENKNGIFKVNDITINHGFDMILSTILRHITDESYFLIIRKNYFIFRIHLS